MIIKRTLITIFAIIALTAQMAAFEPLDSYLKEAAENNPSLQAKFKEYLAAMEKAPQVGTLPDPQVAFGYFILPAETRVGPQRAKISLKQRFPWFGKLESQSDYKTQLAKVKYKEFESMKNSLYFRIKAVWHKIYVIEKEIEFVLMKLEFQEALLSAAKTGYETGSKPLSDIVRINVLINEFEEKINELSDRRGILSAEFNALLSRPRALKIDIPKKLELYNLDISLETAVDSAYNSNANLAVLNQKETAYKEQLTSAEKQSLPDFTLGLDYTLVDSRAGAGIPENGQDIFMPSVSVNIPVFSEKYGAMEREASLLIESVQSKYTDVKNDIAAKLESAYRMYDINKRNIELYERLIAETQSALDILITAYSANGREFNQILGVREKIFEYQLKKEKSAAEMNIATAKIDQLLSNNIYN